MNHGYCQNCWWYKEITGKITIVGRNGIIEIPSEGQCYMLNSMTYGDSYCPDYWNRKHGDKVNKMTLQEWIDKNNM